MQLFTAAWGAERTLGDLCHHCDASCHRRGEGPRSARAALQGRSVCAHSDSERASVSRPWFRKSLPPLCCLFWTTSQTAHCWVELPSWKLAWLQNYHLQRRVWKTGINPRYRDRHAMQKCCPTLPPALHDGRLCGTVRASLRQSLRCVAHGTADSLPHGLHQKEAPSAGAFSNPVPSQEGQSLAGKSVEPTGRGGKQRPSAHCQIATPLQLPSPFPVSHIQWVPAKK